MKRISLYLDNDYIEYIDKIKKEKIFKIFYDENIVDISQFID